MARLTKTLQQNLTEFSVSKTFDDALVEWEWTEKCVSVILEERYVCDLCNRHIKYGFEIFNDFNGEGLWICRCCLKAYIRHVHFWKPISKEEILSKIKYQQQSARVVRKYHERVEAGAHGFTSEDPPSRH